MFRAICLMMMLSFALAAAPLQAQVAATPAPKAASAATVTVKIACMGGFQMDVWLNGKRVGFTPFELKLKPGRYWLTASAEAIMPLMQTLEVKAGEPVQGILLPPVPVTQDNYVEVAKWIMSEIPKQRKNPHLVLMALQLTLEPGESQRLLAVADKMIPGDPMLEVLRAQAIGRAGRLNEALAAADKATTALNYVAYPWRVRADILRAGGRFEEALDSANKAVVLDPLDFRNVRMRGKIYRDMARPREQKADEDRAEELYASLHERAEKAEKKKKAKAGT